MYFIGYFRHPFTFVRIKMKISRDVFLLLIFLASILMRRAGIPGSTFIFLGSGILISLIFLYTGLVDSFNHYKLTRSAGIFPELFFSLAFFILIVRFQYWSTSNALCWINIAVIFFYLLLLWFRHPGRIVFPLLLPAKLSTGNHILVVLILLFFSVAGGALNPREFHNAFRASRYEEYIRQSFPDSLQTKADLLIEKYKCRSAACIEKAKLMFNQALLCDSLRDFNQALKYFNTAVDLNPDEAEYYYRRGHFKLIKMDINAELARSALVDFTRTIQLKPGYANAYYFRGVAYAYLDKRDKVCPDMLYARQLNSAIEIAYFVKQFCPGSDSSFFEQIHP